MMAPWDREKTTHKLCRSAALPSHHGWILGLITENHIGKYVSLCTRVKINDNFLFSELL